MTKQTNAWVTRSLLLTILLLAFALRFYALDAQSLWNDEGTSVALAGRDLATIARDAARDIHPPLYYWFLAGWSRLTGSSEMAVRSLSALLAVATVALIYALGRRLGGEWMGGTAALLAAINPFQVYYAQEARMYALLALLGALSFYAALHWAAAPTPRWSATYVLAATAGFYTHYAFPLVLIALNLVMLPWLALTRSRRGDAMDRLWKLQSNSRGHRTAENEIEQRQTLTTPETSEVLGHWPLLAWLGLQAGAALLFLPWLPAATRQLTSWPRVEGSVAPIQALSEIARLFAVGPADLPWGGTAALLLLLLVTLLPGRRSDRLPRPVAYLAPVAWLVAPVALILGLGLYKEAYVKFLLVASPAFCLLASRVATAACDQKPRGRQVIEGLLGAVVAGLLVAASLHGLAAYYTDPAYARDDYRAIAAYLEAVGRPGDAVLLNAPGQQEVFGYYYRGSLPIHPLPQARPLEPEATRQALETLARPGHRIFAVLWATDESDPQRFIEDWLDSHTYKALDSWYGNVRLAIYAVPDQAPSAPDQLLDVRLQDRETDDEVTLQGYSLLNDQLAAGDIAQFTLFWRAEETPRRRYKVFVHVLDEQNQIVGQRDAEPGGGANLTSLWHPGETVVDNYGVAIHPATPPGAYRVEVGMYDLETGQRLLTPEDEGQVWLEPLRVERPQTAAPVAALEMQYSTDARFGELHLRGYDAHRLGSAHEPQAPLRPGDVLHVNLYWQAQAQPYGDWQVRIVLMDAQGGAWATIEAQPVAGYPTSRWQAGDIWRGQFNLPLPGELPPGKVRLSIQPIAPGGTTSQPFLTKPVTVTR
jgi:mannosyltransferase